MSSSQSTNQHVPQYGLDHDETGYEHNPYHITCPHCGATPGNYCFPVNAGDAAGYIDAVGFAPHRDRREAAGDYDDCDECLRIYGPSRSAETVESAAARREEAAAKNERLKAHLASGGKPWDFPG